MMDIIKQYGPEYLGYADGFHLSGLMMTLWILVLSMTIGMLLSIPLAILRVSSNRVLSGMVKAYTFVFRGTPLYVQLLLVYTGFFSLGFVRSSDFLSDFFRSGLNCVILAFSVNCCAYLTEVLAGSIRSIPAEEIEAARAYGYSPYKLYTQVILPSALKRALPYYSNEVILLLHSTSIAFTATVPELLKIARDVNSETFAPFTSFGIAGAIYAIIATILVVSFRRIERRSLVFLRPATR
ncbi:histidine ABC transporter permease HisM [Paenalcaligenes niemegkensis]|uniref:histidine ABC transporter permease HisM n=1 Tax=Paenalcaligenes niemegkensis TaxID=2895469 RepID=UPI001EE81B03|nr:histidine ABC transporter permease HisM [Paenalcaligenes niemegkensis]MCQ9618296.1 histidine ABC transporter permease HisM [Paenalcaligenes niemegkensis]